MLWRTISLYKNAYSGLSESTWLLSLVMLVNRSGTMVIPFMTIYLTQPSMGYSIAEAGAVMGIFGLGAVCGGFIGGWLTDKFGFYRVQLITLMGGGLLFFLLGQMKSFALLGLSTFCLSFVNEAFRPANSTAIAFFSRKENRTRSYSLNRLAINLGWALGGAIGGILATINYHLLFWVDGATNIAAAILLRFLLSPTSYPKTHIKREKACKPVQSAYKDKTYLGFIASTILFASCFFLLFTVLPVYYKKELLLPEYFIGMLMALNGLIIVFIEMILIFKLEGRRNNLFYISSGVLVVGFSYLLLNILPSLAATAVFCMVMVSFGEIFSMPFMNSFWIARTVPSNRGQYAGLYTIAWSTAQVIGPVGGSQIAQHFGFRALWWTTGGLCLISSLGFKWLRKFR